MMLAQKLKQYRKDKQLTQEELAIQLNISRSAVAKWEQEKVLPSRETIKDISELLQCSENELMDKDEPLVIIENITSSSRRSIQKLILSFSLAIVLLGSVLLALLYKPFGNIIDRSVSPDGEIRLTIYDNTATDFLINNESGYKIIVSGLYSGTWIKKDCSYKGVYWSSDSRYVVESYEYLPDNKSWLELIDFKSNSGTNLQVILESKLALHYGLTRDSSFSNISDFQFMQWSEKGNLMLIKYNLVHENKNITGYFWSSMAWNEPLIGLAEIGEN